MSLFKCSRCGCVENTALCNYWARMADKKSPLCSECDPAIKKWHAKFPKMPAEGSYVDDGHGHLITLEEAEMRKWQNDVVKTLPDDIKRFGAKGVVRGAFERGWNYGAHYAREHAAPVVDSLADVLGKIVDATQKPVSKGYLKNLIDKAKDILKRWNETRKP